jgi:hypothetical protein
MSTNPNAKAHHTGGGDRFTIEAGGVITVKSGGAIRVESGGMVEIQTNWKTVAGTTYGLTDSDSGKTLKTTNGSAVSINVPAGLSIAPISVRAVRGRPGDLRRRAEASRSARLRR